MKRFRLTFVVLSMLFFGAVSRADAQAAEPTRKAKDPTTATLWSVFLIGGGQAYSGEWPRALLLAGLGYVPLGLAMSSTDDCIYDAVTNPDCGGADPLLIGGIVASMATYFYSIFDARNAARRHNRKHGIASILERMHPLIGATGTATHAGFRVQLGR